LVLTKEWSDLDEKAWVRKYQALPQSNFRWRAPWVSGSSYLMGSIDWLNWIYQLLTLIGGQTVWRSTIRAKNLGVSRVHRSV